MVWGTQGEYAMLQRETAERKQGMSTQGRAQFTPGPWIVRPDSTIESKDGVTIASFVDNEADMSIISAAPAMYGELSVSTNLLCRALPYLPDAVAKELVKQRQINMQVLSQAEGRQT